MRGSKVSRKWFQVFFVGFVSAYGLFSSACHVYTYGPGGATFRRYDLGGELISGGDFCGDVYVNGRKADGRARFKIRYSVDGIEARAVRTTRTLVDGRACFSIRFPRPANLDDVDPIDFEVIVDGQRGKGRISGHDFDSRTIFARFELKDSTARNERDPVGLKHYLANLATFGLLDLFASGDDARTGTTGRLAKALPAEAGESAASTRSSARPARTGAGAARLENI